jgi:hypothetical protein
MIERSEAGKAVETTVFARHRREGLAADEIGDVSNIDQYVGYPTCQNVSSPALRGIHRWLRVL